MQVPYKLTVSDAMDTHLNLTLAKGADVDDQDKRRDLRLKHRANIRVILPTPSEPFLAVMRDFSNSGLFIQCSSENIPEIGAIVEVQTTEIEDAPIRRTQVVRIQAGIGFGVVFI